MSIPPSSTTHKSQDSLPLHYFRVHATEYVASTYLVQARTKEEAESKIKTVKELHAAFDDETVEQEEFMAFDIELDESKTVDLGTVTVV